MVKKPRKPDPDRCEPQRGRLAQLDLEIGEDLDQLGSPDLTADQRRRIEAELEQRQLRRPQLVRLLVECEARAGDTARKKKITSAKKAAKKNKATGTKKTVGLKKKPKRK